MARNIYERNEDKNQRLRRMSQSFWDVMEYREAIEFRHLTELFDIGVTSLELTEELKKSGVFNEDGLPVQCFVDREYFSVVETEYVSNAETNIVYRVFVHPLGIAFILGFMGALKDRNK